MHLVHAVLHAVDHAAGTQEQQALEESMRNEDETARPHTRPWPWPPP